MNSQVMIYAGIFLLGVLIAGISQVMLKKSAMIDYGSWIREYLNVRVILAYGLFFASTLVTVYAYKVIPVSMGPILDSTGYIYVTIFGVLIFKEKLNAKKVIALILILTGIVVYSIFG